jgi:hypothetical protein
MKDTEIFYVMYFYRNLQLRKCNSQDILHHDIFFNYLC